MATLTGGSSRKQLSLPPALVVLLVTLCFSSLLYAWWDGYSCTSEVIEARDSLIKIRELEEAYKEKTGKYSPMDPCSFLQTENGVQETCVSRIGFTMIGTSRFAYQVELTPSGFLATAVGAEGRQLGNVLRIDQSGALNVDDARCHE